ncbi:MAG: sigma-70 family RNA polymerase sigma factor [Candidatus Eremiobacteraeota bacterium]|nr:sigma-70 family RNA polymerase sigma factor [Candidatus Eremiobacteraeota bacterium]
MSTRETTIRDLFPLVRRVARRVARIVPSADLDDLVGDGSIGLIRAVDTYDPARGTLENYARKLVLGAMLNGLRRMDPISERARRTLRDAERQRQALAQERGAMPSQAEMELRIAGLKSARIAAFRHGPVSLEATYHADGPAYADWTADPAKVATAVGERREIVEAIRLLPDRQRRVIALHYYCRFSLHAIGTQLNVSPQRVSQLHLRALARLRGLLAAR